VSALDDGSTRDLDVSDGQAKLRPATPADREDAGRLLALAARELAEPIFGLGQPGRAERAFAELFERAGTMWSHDCSTVAELDGRVIGLIGHIRSRELAWRGLRTGVAMLGIYGPLGVLRLGWRGRHMGRGRPRQLDRGTRYVPNLAVDPAYRDRGIGSRLLEAAHAAGRAHGATSCVLEVILENSDAIRLYQRHGYVEIARHRSEGLRRLTGASGMIYMQRPLGGPTEAVS
jgi:ribosomal protein S18 acetylase RimI-like enzyme